jgi:hypothetical protein
MERALVLRDSSNIKQFTLSYHVIDEATLVSSWISAAVRCNVEELYIDLDSLTQPFSLPHSLFTCLTLTKLELEMRCTLKLPLQFVSQILKACVLHMLHFGMTAQPRSFFLDCQCFRSWIYTMASARILRL